MSDLQTINSIYEIWYRAAEKFVQRGGRAYDYMESTRIALSSLSQDPKFEYHIGVLQTANSLLESSARVAGLNPDSDAGKEHMDHVLLGSIVNTQTLTATSALVRRAKDEWGLDLRSLTVPDGRNKLEDFVPAIDRTLGIRKAAIPHRVLKAA